MVTPIDLVADWHAKFGVPLPTVPTFTPEVCALRIALLREELAEFDAAKAAGNRVEMLDALCDLKYVLSGAVLHLGLRAEFDRWIPVNAPRCSIIDSTIGDLSEEISARDTEESSFQLSWMQDILTRMIHEEGFSEVFSDAFMAVHMNNCGKVWMWHDVMNKPEVALAARDLELTPCGWLSGGYIARNAAGKIIKPPGHTKVDLTPFVS